MSFAHRLAFGVSASIATLSSFVPAHAEDAAGAQTVVVTATRNEQTLDKVGDSITLLEPEHIRASQKRLASDLLARTPGVSATRNGGPGTVTALRIRGAETDQTVVLFDGVKLNDPAAVGAGYNFANLVLDDASRIEILRGPQSVLWGSQAIGGVVNIVTPQASGPLSGNLTAEGGGHNSGFGRVTLQNGGDRFSWRASANYLTTESISSADERLGNSEPDPYRNTGANVSATYRFNETVSADFHTMFSDGRSDFDGFMSVPPFSPADSAQFSETQDLVSYLGVKIAAPHSRWTHRLGYAYTDTDSENFDPAQAITTRTFVSEGRNKRVEYVGSFAFSPTYTLTFGGQTEKSDFSSASPSAFDPSPTPIRRDVRLDGAFAQLQASPIGALTLTAGARYDDHETFGGHTTVRAAAAWSVAENTILRASYGEGFKAPSLYQLYSEYGNTRLRAEDARGWDASIEQRLADGKVSASAAYFQRDTDNMIDFFSCFGGSDPRCVAQPFGFYDNIAKTKAAGVELMLVTQLTEALSLNANYTRLDTENAAPDSVNFGRDLPRRPEHTFNVDVSYAWPLGVTTAVAIQQVGDSFDNTSNSVRLDSFTLVDLRVEYAFSVRLNFFARMENALDESYNTAAGYGTMGRTAYGGVRLSF